MTDWQEQLVDGISAAIAPRNQSEVWEWSESNVHIPAGKSRFPGPLSFRHTPYMIGEWSPLWAYRRYVEVSNIWAAQTGKTLMLIVTALYDIAIDPGPGMIVYPDQVTARRRSKHYFQPILEASLPEYLTGDRDDIQLLEYKLKNCYWVLAWAGSPSVLAAEPIKHLKLDEEGKYPEKTEKEADPKRLAMRRVISYGEFATVFSATTPSLESLPGWRDWKNSTKCEYYVPCPKCGHEQVMYFSNEDRRWFRPGDDAEWTGGIKWDRDPKLSFDARCASAYYQCESCGTHWGDAEKDAAVCSGHWVAGDPSAARYASHLPSWYAPWVKLREVVRRWLESYKDEGARHDFLNSDCAVPYELKGKSIEQSKLRKHILPALSGGRIPESSTALYITADVHDDHIRYRLRAWAPDFTSWGIEEGILPPQMENLDSLLSRTWDGPSGPMLPVGLVDARWRTDEVYQLCLRSAGRLWPVMGTASDRDLIKYKVHHVAPNPERGLLLGGRVIRVDVNDHRWKDILIQRIETPLGEPGAWYVEPEATSRYFYEMAGEVKIIRQRAGRPTSAWIQQHDNHVLDCEKYQLVCCTVFQLGATRPAEKTESAESAESGVINPYTGRPIQ